MSTTLTIAVGFGAALIFMLLAWWMWRRGRAAGRLEVTQALRGASTSPEVTAAVPPPPREPSGTIAIPPPFSKRAPTDEVTQVVPPPSLPAGTELVPHEEILAAIAQHQHAAEPELLPPPSARAQ
mgnify:CR=1 FL=1